MSEEDLVKRLRVVTGFIRFETGDRVAASVCLSEEAADRIEALTAKLAKALELAKEAIETMVSGPFYPEEEERRLLAKLAEIEGGKGCETNSPAPV